MFFVCQLSFFVFLVVERSEVIIGRHNTDADYLYAFSLLYAKRVLFVRATGRDVILPMLMIHFEVSQREVSIIHVILVVERSEIIRGRRRFRRGLFIIICYYIYKACILCPREWT